MRFMWSRLTSSKWEDAWRESLRFVGATRLAIFSMPGRDRIRLEVYSLAKRDAAALVERFGGKIRRQPSTAEIVKAAPRTAPLKIRGRLTVRDSGRAAPGTIVVPAGMAFGTGEHATTATCLRLLVDVSRPLTRWTMLDLGTGSGILAIAAHQLGARRVEACDFDADAVRVARQNTAANAAPEIRIIRRDVTRWTPRRSFDIVTANLFSRVLIDAAPAIAASVSANGQLIFSGVLREQLDACLETFSKCNLHPLRIVRRGKWVTVLAARPEKH